jgi:hypothetical protein
MSSTAKRLQQCRFSGRQWRAAWALANEWSESGVKMRSIGLFLLECVVTGLGAAFATMVGHFGGHSMLLVGGMTGGLSAAALGARLAERLGLIQRVQLAATATGAALGFLAAAYVSLHTLSSPVGPVLSTSLIGIGALLGARISA